MKHRFIAYLSILFLLLFAGCSSSTDTDSGLIGKWIEENGSQNIELNLQDDQTFTIEFHGKAAGSEVVSSLSGTYTTTQDSITFIAEESKSQLTTQEDSSTSSHEKTEETEVQEQLTYTYKYELDANELTLTAQEGEDSGANTGIPHSLHLTRE